MVDYEEGYTDQLMGFWDELTREELVIMHNAVEEAWLTGVIGDFLGRAEAGGDR